MVWPQNHWDSFSRFSLNTDGVGFPSLGFKNGSYSLVIWLQNHGAGFLVWASKQSGLRFVSCTTKPIEDEDGAGHASRSSGLLCMKASRARVSHSGLKTGVGTTTGGAHGTITEVA
jgi:hypothetical protein